MVSQRSTWLSVLMVLTVLGNGLPPAFSQTPNQQCNNYTLSINSSLTLEQVVNSSSNNHSLETNCVRIEVYSGRYTLTSQILFPAEVGEIEFVGLENDATVMCAYKDVQLDYTWYFDHLSSVTIRGIHFEKCPRPLRLDTISNVVIQNCSFRYISINL